MFNLSFWGPSEPNKEKRAIKKEILALEKQAGNENFQNRVKSETTRLERAIETCKQTITDAADPTAENSKTHYLKGNLESFLQHEEFKKSGLEQQLRQLQAPEKQLALEKLRLKVVNSELFGSDAATLDSSSKDEDGSHINIIGALTEIIKLYDLDAEHTIEIEHTGERVSSPVPIRDKLLREPENTFALSAIRLARLIAAQPDSCSAEELSVALKALTVLNNGTIGNQPESQNKVYVGVEEIDIPAEYSNLTASILQLKPNKIEPDPKVLEKQEICRTHKKLWLSVQTQKNLSRISTA